MGSFIGICGHEAQDSTRDRIIILAGTPVYDTVNIPTGGSASSMGGNGVQVRIPWYNDVGGGVNTPSAEELWFHCHYYTNLNNTNNDFLRLGVSTSSTEFITVSAQDTTNLLTIRVAGVVVATASTDAFSLATWHRVHMHISGYQASDTVNVYLDGDLSTPSVSYTLTGANATALAGIGDPNEFRIHMKSGDGNGRADNLLAWDPNGTGTTNTINSLLEPSVKPRVFTGNGSNTDWTGSYTDIDEIPNSDADKITSSAVGDISGFTAGAISADNVLAVKVMARITRTGTDAGSNITIRTLDGADTEDRTMAAPGDGDVYTIYDLHPDGLAWSATKLDTTTIEFESVT